jgi:hypothetical protein
MKARSPLLLLHQNVVSYNKKHHSDMHKLLVLLFLIVVFQACRQNTVYFVDDPNEDKIALINIDTVYKTITDDSIKIRIGFKNIPSDTIQYSFLRAEIVFDINNDTIYKDDLSLGFLAFIPDTTIHVFNFPINEIVKNGAIKALFKYNTLIDNGYYYELKKSSL